MDFLDGWHLTAQVARETVMQTIPNAVDTILTYQTEDFDQGGMVNLAVNNDRIIIRQHGVYDVSGRVIWDGTNVTGDRRGRILVNGSSVWGSRIKALVTSSFGNSPFNCIVTTLALAPNDYVQLSAFQTADSAASVDIRFSFLTVGKCARKAG
jgi:hypothetical protein